MALTLAACGGSGGSGGSMFAGMPGEHASPTTAKGPTVRLTVTPAGGVDDTPGRGLSVRASGGTIEKVVVHTTGDPVSGDLNAGRTAWHSRWSLGVGRSYSVTVTAKGRDGKRVVRTSGFRTLQPKQTFTAKIVQAYGETYGVGIPIVLYFDRHIVNRAAVERALEVRASKHVMGSWYWDDHCRVATQCLYFRTQHYWPTNTKVSFVGHFDGVQAAPGVYGHHTLTQSFQVGGALTAVASTAGHYMNVYKDGKLFAHWPISTGRPGDDTPNGNYLAIEKANPVQMTGPGYSLSVPYSVRFTFSGDYVHDAYWSVGSQGFSNVSHGCVNLSPEHSAIYYDMAVPGDPIKVIGSPRAGTWDDGWTMWFLGWKQWQRGSALHRVAVVGPGGTQFLRPGELDQKATPPARTEA